MLLTFPEASGVSIGGIPVTTLTSDAQTLQCSLSGGEYFFPTGQLKAARKAGKFWSVP